MVYPIRTIYSLSIIKIDNYESIFFSEGPWLDDGREKKKYSTVHFSNERRSKTGRGWRLSGYKCLDHWLVVISYIRHEQKVMLFGLFILTMR